MFSSWSYKFFWNFENTVVRVLHFIKRTILMSSETSGEMSISPTRLHNPDYTIRSRLTTSFTAELHVYSPKIPTEKYLARVLLLNVNGEKIRNKVLSFICFFYYSQSSNCRYFWKRYSDSWHHRWWTFLGYDFRLCFRMNYLHHPCHRFECRWSDLDTKLMYISKLITQSRIYVSTVNLGAIKKGVQ